MLLSKSTKVESSPKKFDEVKRKETIVLESNDLCSLGANQKVTVTMKRPKFQRRLRRL